MWRMGMGVILFVVGGCGDGAPVNVVGRYSLTLTNEENGCGLPGWNEGDTFSDTVLRILQDDHEIMAELEGASALWSEYIFGDDTLSGDVSGHRVSLSIEGTRQVPDRDCPYAVGLEIDVRADGDLLEGQAVYYAITNQSPSCGIRNDCESRQLVYGRRLGGCASCQGGER